MPTSSAFFGYVWQALRTVTAFYCGAAKQAAQRSLAEHAHAEIVTGVATWQAGDLRHVPLGGVHSENDIVARGPGAWSADHYLGLDRAGD